MIRNIRYIIGSNPLVFFFPQKHVNGNGLAFPIADGAGKWIEFHNGRDRLVPVDTLVPELRQRLVLHQTSQALTENSDLLSRRNVDLRDCGEHEVV